MLSSLFTSNNKVAHSDVGEQFKPATFSPDRIELKQIRQKLRNHFRKVKQLGNRASAKYKFSQIGGSNKNLLLQQREAVVDELIEKLNTVSCSNELKNLVSDSIREGIDCFLDKHKEVFHDDLYYWNDDMLHRSDRLYYLRDLSKIIHNMASQKLGVEIYPAHVFDYEEGPIVNEEGISIIGYGYCTWHLQKDLGQFIGINFHPDISQLDGLTNLKVLLHEIGHSIHAQTGHIVLFDYDKLTPEQKERMEPFLEDGAYVIELQRQNAVVSASVSLKAYKSSACERLARTGQEHVIIIEEQFERQMGRTLPDMIAERKDQPHFM